MRMVEYNVAVKQDAPEEKTKGGLYLTDAQKEIGRHQANKGVITHLSPMAFTFEDWPEDEPKPSVGDRVLFSPHAGMFHKEGSDEYRLMKDKDIVAVLS